MERTIGLIARRIKSRSAPEVNAANEMSKLAAYRYYNNVLDAKEYYTTSGPNQSMSKLNNTTYRVDFDDGTWSELWNVKVVKEGKPFSKVDEFKKWNLCYYLQAYWSRQEELWNFSANAERGTRAAQRRKGRVITNGDDIIVGSQYFNSGDIYDSAIYQHSSKKYPSNFLKLSLPVDPSVLKNNATNKTGKQVYFGEALMYFSHSYKGTLKIIVIHLPCYVYISATYLLMMQLH